MPTIKHMRQFLSSQRLRRFVLAIVFLGLLLAPVPVHAQGGGGRCSSFFFLQSWGCYVPEKITHIKDFLGILFWAADSLLKLIAYVAAGFIIYGGIKYMMAQGDQGGLSEAKSTVTNAVIGLVIAIASVALVQFVAEAIA